MIDSINDIVDLHESRGNIEDAYIKIHIDNKVMMLNKYTLRFRRGNAPKAEIKEWNIDVFRNIKRNRNLEKEVKEFISLFEYLEKAKIKSGYIEKSETPDFILTRNGEKTGIEITKIYIGNDWVANKLNEEVKEYRLRKNELDGYIEYKKYNNRVKTVKVRGGLIIAPNTSNITMNEYISEFKNKIFIKVRKLTDDYFKFENNIIFVEVVSSEFFSQNFDKEKMCEELNYYVNYIEADFSNTVAKVIIKIGNELIEYNLSERTYKVI
ncbi:MAG: hypothetical protein IJ220_00685 [Clostridia bacterium]|nr:hypothetical protein [Clostridia bacterium]